jgi:phage terminase large subunit-like protein
MTRDELYTLATTSTDDLTQYCNDAISGEIVSCKKHKWACQRFLNDLARQNTKDFPYKFDEDRANKFLKWMTFFKHTKGPLEGEYKIPVDIEKFVFGNIYGWVHTKTEYRRFRKAYWQVARKNAKSQDLAILGLYELAAFGEPSSEVYVAATKKEQANFVWEEADTIYRKCKFLDGKIKTAYGIIRHLKSSSKFQRLTKDDKKKGDGSNPQCLILDEYHAHETTEYYDVGTSGMKARKQPLSIIITTAGFELNNPCYREEYKYISEILNPDLPVENDRYFAMVNELDKDDEGNLIDDVKDEAVWPKANPIVTLTDVGLESIRDELKVALDKPEKMRDFLTKTMNVWVNMREAGYMDMEKWKLCIVDQAEIYRLIRGLPAFVGFDLSATIDLTSASIEIPLPDGRIAALSHSFIPEATLFTKMKTDNVPYDVWKKQGWLTITPGNEVDYRFMVKWVDTFLKKLELVEKEFCFDRYMATLLMQELTDEGHTVIEIPQGIPTLGIPTKDFRAKVYNRMIIHDNNPLLTLAIGNAVTRQDHNDNLMLDKSKSTRRIDPIAAMINAHVRVMANIDDTSVYESRGIASL